jgi:hypothetical protein
MSKQAVSNVSYPVTPGTTDAFVAQARAFACRNGA